MNNRPLCYQGETFEEPRKNEAFEDLRRTPQETMLNRVCSRAVTKKGIPKSSMIYIRRVGEIKVESSQTKWRIYTYRAHCWRNSRTRRGDKIKTATGYVFERPVQLVCDLEISGLYLRTSLFPEKMWRIRMIQTLRKDLREEQSRQRLIKLLELINDHEWRRLSKK